MPVELENKYNHTSAEKKWYKIWENSGSFSPDHLEENKEKPPFSIVIPPPNVTGQLHVGHALDSTIQDVLIRFARKRGFNTLWIPGTDHAGIATQSRVEKMLKEDENLTKFDLGREKFVERVWEWKKHYGGLITSQMRKLGLSVDWKRERFTMDEGLSKAVRKVFVDLYRQGLIYRDTRLVNWDTVSHTVLSDLEVEYEENFKSELWSFAYPLKDGDGEIIVATTRPETMLGDTAVAVHPEDPRYKKLIGKTVKHPLLDRDVPIIGDAILVDPEFGTGAVKVTPAHDPNDFEVGRRHDLEFITIFDETGCVNENGGKYKGIDRFEARKIIKKDLADLGLERGSKEHVMSIGRSQRSGSIVEPMISTQWFVKIKPLAEPAIRAVETKQIRFVPSQWENTYFSWMREIRDWCISRQLWWGHQIPAFHCEECGHITVSEKDPSNCEKCKSKKIKQDPDVLDTWFSSALWPFSTSGWPDKTPDLAKYYPTTVLVTGYDIIFFWVARMIMMGLYFMGSEPFKYVYIHGLMRDEKGRKISKSLGNNIDPVDVIETYGADAYRFFLMATLTEGKDSVYNESRLKGYQNFANKVWNSSRFVLMNLPDDFKPDFDHKKLKLESEDKWILSRLNHTIQEMDNNLGTFKFHLATDDIYSFVWNNYCDWYIELIKPRLYGKLGEESAETARQTSFYVLYSMLGLLHPFMPFITEELHSILRKFYDDSGNSSGSAPAKSNKSSPDPDEMIITSPWPSPLDLSKKDEDSANAFNLLQEVIGCARMIRAEAGIAPDKKVPIAVRSKSKELKSLVKEKEIAILRLAQAESVIVDDKYSSGKFDSMEPFSEGEVFVPLEGVLDIHKEIERLQGDRDKMKSQADGLDKKLSNKGFLNNAPADVVEKEKGKLAELREKTAAIEAALKRFGV